MVRNSNHRILQIFRENSRTPFVKIAKTLKVSETAVRKRVRKMEQAGVIRKYTVDIDPKKVGFQVQALIGVDTKPESYISTMEKLKGMKDVISLYSSSGDHMIMLECWFKDTKELTKFEKKIKAIKGVTKTCPAIVLEKIK